MQVHVYIRVLMHMCSRNIEWTQTLNHCAIILGISRTLLAVQLYWVHHKAGPQGHLWLSNYTGHSPDKKLLDMDKYLRSMKESRIFSCSLSFKTIFHMIFVILQPVAEQNDGSNQMPDKVLNTMMKHGGTQKPFSYVPTGMDLKKFKEKARQ